MSSLLNRLNSKNCPGNLFFLAHLLARLPQVQLAKYNVSKRAVLKFRPRGFGPHHFLQRIPQKTVITSWGVPRIVDRARKVFIANPIPSANIIICGGGGVEEITKTHAIGEMDMQLMKVMRTLRSSRCPLPVQ